MNGQMVGTTERQWVADTHQEITATCDKSTNVQVHVHNVAIIVLSQHTATRTPTSIHNGTSLLWTQLQRYPLTINAKQSFSRLL